MDALTKPHEFPGRLIIVEGIDGSGKSTQLQLAMRYLQAKGLPVFFTVLAPSWSGHRASFETRPAAAPQDEEDFYRPDTPAASS